jgi:hypothetical protein
MNDDQSSSRPVPVRIARLPRRIAAAIAAVLITAAGMALMPRPADAATTTFGFEDLSFVYAASSISTSSGGNTLTFQTPGSSDLSASQ